MTQTNHISFSSVPKESIINAQGIKYVDFRDSLRQRHFILWWHIGIIYLVLAATLVGSVYLQHQTPYLPWINIPLTALLTGYSVAALNLFMHEASHFHFSDNKKRNDLLANISVGIIIGMETNFYRSVHFAHHRLIGSKNDTEKSYFNGISWRFIIESLTGIRLLRVLSHRNGDIVAHYGSREGKSIVRKNRVVFLLAMGTHCLILATLFYMGYWQTALGWMAGMGILFPFFAMFRQILEHRTPQARSHIDYATVDQGASHRLFGDGPIASTLGAAGFNRHLIHHWDPQVPYTRLKDVELFLMDTPLGPELEKNRSTYIKTFLLILNK